jgi:hypothetical protein
MVLGAAGGWRIAVVGLTARRTSVSPGDSEIATANHNMVVQQPEPIKPEASSSGGMFWDREKRKFMVWDDEQQNYVVASPKHRHHTEDD